MPKLEPKAVQKELDSGQIWPVYWLYGQERMKTRELLKRIRKAALGETPSGFCAETVLEGSEVDADQIVEAAQSPSLGGGTQLLIVRDAHAIKNADSLAVLLGPRAPLAEQASVVVFVSKDLDGRKKFSKVLTEKAAVVPCEEIAEPDREAWIQYLAKKRGLALTDEQVAQLVILDPWTLDIIDLELEKVSLSGDGDAFLSGSLSLGALGGADAFLECFFLRKSAEALKRVAAFADQPDESLPLLGLFAWNVRNLALVVLDRERGTRKAKLNPYLAEKFKSWASRWSVKELEALQQEVAAIDFGFKQTPLMPLGLWDTLVMKHC